jgi:hypothetical protein
MIAATATILGIIIGSSWYRFGGLGPALSYSIGHHIIISEKVKDIGVVRRGMPSKFRYSLTNLTARPVKIIGAGMSCSCTSANKLPDVLPAAETQAIEIVFTPSQSQPEGEFTGMVRLFTDDLRDRELVLTFLARVGPSPAGH